MSFKNTVKPILVLTLICLAVALLLAVVNYSLPSWAFELFSSIGRLWAKCI